MLSVGEILKKTREEKGLSYLQIEKEIKVRRKFIQAIENNDWSFFTSKIYIVGIISNYSNLLGLDHKKMLAFFRREYEKKEDVSFKKKVATKYLTPENKKYVSFGLFLIVSLFFIYFIYQLNLFLIPPKVKIIEPKTSVFKKLDRIKIIGQTEKEATIIIFGNRVYQDKEGIFEYNLPLKQGKNILNIEIVGANGKKTIIQKEYINQQ